MELRVSDTVVFHVRIIDMLRAHLSGNSTGEFTNPIAQSVMRTFSLPRGTVRVTDIAITLFSDSPPTIIPLWSSPLMRFWIWGWDEGLFKIRRPFHFEVKGRQKGNFWEVMHIWR